MACAKLIQITFIAFSASFKQISSYHGSFYVDRPFSIHEGFYFPVNTGALTSVRHKRCSTAPLTFIYRNEAKPFTRFLKWLKPV